MDTAIQLTFRFLAYVLFGLTLEVVFAVLSLERMVGAPIPRRVPKRYLEGWVSLYMIPLHGLGVLFGIEALHDLIRAWRWPARYLVWCVAFTGAEWVYGWLQDKLLGFYTWDYYALSRWRMGARGYSLWTLVPCWGLAGLVIEVYSDLMRYLSPHVSAYFLG
jgi:hypothetical protein